MNQRHRATENSQRLLLLAATRRRNTAMARLSACISSKDCDNTTLTEISYDIRNAERVIEMLGGAK